MTLRTVGLLMGLAVAAVPVATAKPGTRYTIEQLMASDKITGLAFSPDDSKILFASTRTGVANLYVMPVRGGKPEALTQSSETLAPLGWFPNDERLLYTADQGGNELRHIYVRERDGKVRDVTPGAKVRALFVSWAPDGQSFFVVTNERDPRFLDLYEYRVADYSRQLLFQNDQSYQIRAVSPDRHYVGLSRIADNATTHSYIYDTRTKALRQLTPDRGGVAGEPQTFSLDSKALFLTTDEGREFTYLVRFDIASGERRVVLQTNWDVSGAGLSENGRYLVVATNEDAHTRVRILDPTTFAPIVTADTGAGTTDSFVLAHHEPLAVFTQANGDVPGDVWTLDLKSGRKNRLMTSLAPGVSQADLVPGEIVRFKSYDGLTIPGVLYVPQGAAKNHKAPAVVWVHGGPGGESRVGYTPLAQYLVNHGYVYYAINNRGSDGSGRTFYHLDDRKHGDADLDDVVASKQMLIDSGYVDPARIAIAGGSYGGFMTLAGLTFRPDAFAAGVDLYGVANWPRLLQNTPAWWEDLRRLLATEMGDVNKDAEYLRSISPVLHAERIRKPLLVLQGANDPRVLQQESDDIVAKVRANGVPVQYVVFPDEGHGFRKKANEITAYRAIKDFLDAHVRGATSAP